MSNKTEQEVVYKENEIGKAESEEKEYHSQSVVYARNTRPEASIPLGTHLAKHKK